MKNQLFVVSKHVIALASFLIMMFVAVQPTYAEEEKPSVNIDGLLQELRWQSESKVRAKLGDPLSIRGPIGTHASYQLWNYPNFSVAFANNRAFHVFDEDSLRKLELEEER